MLRTALAAFVMAVTMMPAHAGRLASVDIYDRNSGRILPVYSKDGQLFVPGEPGHEYEIRLRNNTGRRLLAVTSVDGVNIVTGEDAHPDQSGYVLDGHGRADIAGWRKTLDRIATFYFTALPDSYAARTGRPDNVGVIGIALFQEEKPWRCCWPFRSQSEEGARRSDSAQAPSSAPAELGDSDMGTMAESQAAPRAKRESKLGTGHGRSEQDRVTHTTFERASSSPEEVIRIYYDSYNNLVAMGVIPVYSRNQRPDPFPGGFVPDP